MSCFSKLREVWYNFRHRKHEQSPGTATTVNPISDDSTQEDPYGALSEIAATSPVERLQSDDTPVDPASDDWAREDPYGALSEVTAPAPVGRPENEHKDTIEKHLYHSS